MFVCLKEYWQISDISMLGDWHVICYASDITEYDVILQSMIEEHQS